MAKRQKPKLSVVKDGQPQVDPGGASPAPEQNDPKAEAEQEERMEAAANRDDELCNDKKIRERVIDLMKDVSKGFEAQWERGNDQLDYWDIYDQVTSARQAYSGNSQVYLPIVYQAIEARVIRFVNQMFPRSQRSVDCISSDEKPYDIMALLEHYVRKARMRTQVIPALMRNGDVEGQYNVYVGWENSSRHVVYRTKPKIEIGGEDGDEPEEVEDPTAEDDEFDVEETETFHMSPVVEVLADADVCVLPHTANSVGEALAKGGSATVIRRWSKARVEQAIDEDEIDETAGAELLTLFGANKDEQGAPSANKKHVDAAGITMGSGSKELTLYETWTKLKIGDERRLVRIYYAGTKGDAGTEEMIASVKRAPYWNDKCPILSAPVKKVSNVFKGKSQVKPVADLQYSANDVWNEGMDSASYALMPIVMTDPAKNPRVGSMVLNLAAIWETNPNDTKFAQFPQLWKDALTIVGQIKTEIFQILSVSPAQMPQSTGGKAKRNQAEVALEQQVDVLSAADVSTNLEDEILTPLLRWFVDLDYQFRDKPITVKQFGQMALRASMTDVPILENSRRFEFRWWGVEAARGAQALQQQVSMINVVKGMPPQSYEGYKLNLVPVILSLVENTFGARVAPQIFENIKDKLTLPPEQENEYLIEGLDLPVHELDDDQEHLKVHIKAMVQGDSHGAVRQHMLLHRMQMNKKMQMAAQQLAGQQGSPGGGGQPGAAGQPRPGAQPMPPRGGQQPPGAIHSDRMQDPGAAPRR